MTTHDSNANEVSEITPIGVTNFRNTNQPFGIKDEDRLGHIYMIGKSGTGKTTLLRKMCLSDINRGKGLALIDPHGDIARELLEKMPLSRRSDVIYFNPKDLDHPMPLNPLFGINPRYHHLVASGLISTFKKIWYDSWGPRMEYILRYALLTLLWFPEATLLDIQPLLTNKAFRETVLSHVRDDTIKSFWKDEFDKYPVKTQTESIMPILNKTGLFITSLPLRKTVGQSGKALRMQHLIDSGKILIANLAKGEIGEDAASLLGSMLITSIQLAAMHRSKQPEETRRPFYIYVDECHSFLTVSFADIFSEARKYRLSLFLTHQYIGQLQESIRAAIFGNVGTLICFRVGADDAAFLKREFYPPFDEEDLLNLPRYCMYIKLMIDGTTSKPFSAKSTV